VLKVFLELKVTLVCLAQMEDEDQLGQQDHQVTLVHLVSQVTTALQVHLDWLVKVELQDKLVQQVRLELTACVVRQDSRDLLDRKVLPDNEVKLALQVTKDSQDSKDNKDHLAHRVSLVLEELKE